MTVFYRCGLSNIQQFDGIATQVTGLPSAIASFVANASGLVLPTLKTTIEAVQSGSGDPSQSNSRPISGWTEAKLSRVGKNLLTMDYLERGSISGSGSFINSSLRLRTSGSIYTMLPIKPSQVYTYSLQGAEGVTNLQFMEANEYSKNRVWLRNQALNKVTGQYTPSADCYYVIFLIRKSDNSTIDVSDVEYLQLEVGSSTATAYESYNGTTVTLQFGTTIYGGIIDWTSGLMTVTHVDVDMGTMNWSFITDRGWSTTDLIGVAVLDYNNPSFIAEQWRTHGWTDRANGDIVCNSGGAVFCVTTDNVNQPQGKMVYELATPTTIQLTPQQIEQLRGENNVFVDCGEVEELEYIQIQQIGG